jgi:hypothetical protein
MKDKITKVIKEYRAPLIGVGFLLASVIFWYINSYSLRNYGIYSVAIVTDVKYFSRSGEYSKYYFYYNGKKYEGESKTDNLIKKDDIGKRYFVKFEKKNPNSNGLQAKKPVPDCITEVPPEGWDTIPKCMNEHGKDTLKSQE